MEGDGLLVRRGQGRREKMVLPTERGGSRGASASQVTGGVNEGDSTREVKEWWGKSEGRKPNLVEPFGGGNIGGTKS